MPTTQSTAEGKKVNLRTGCLILVLLPLAYYAVQAALRTPPSGDTLIIAHRGGQAYAPENTLAAFRKAIAQGATAVEFDVQRSKDGRLVVIHDETVDRTTSGTGAVRDLTLSELWDLDAGGGERIPTLDEVIELAKPSGVLLFPEAKSPQLYPGLEGEMVETLRSAGYLDHAVIQSFDSASLERLRRVSPESRLCALYGSGRLNVAKPAADAEYVCPMAEMVLINPGMIRQGYGEGRHVIVWFLATESPLSIRILRFFGADGFIVDDPVSARGALGGQ